MKILITGATGFVASTLIPLLMKDNHQIVVLTRDVEKARKKLPFPFEFYKWTPETAPAPMQAFKDIDAVIHLAGEGIADKRWSAKQKDKIRMSRVQGTENLVYAVNEYVQKPLKAFISTSAVGYYGESTATTPLDESSPQATGFLSEVCEAWEKSAQKIQKTERLVIVRVGVVLGATGGALKKMLLPFQLGVGGRIGSGEQGMSWIHEMDLARIYQEALTNTSLNGVVNAVSPQPVSNRVFTQALGQTLNRPTLFPVPSMALKLALGEMSEVILKSQFILPKKLAQCGFTFLYEDIHSALDNILNKQVLPPLKKKVCSERFVAYQWIPKPRDEVFQYFCEAKNLETLTPPWLKFKVLKQSTNQIEQGTLINYKLKIRGLPISWQTHIESWHPPKSFTDTQLKGPYTLWHHTHEFFDYQNGTLMKDCVFYKVPLGIWGEIFGLWFVKKDVKTIFRYRFQQIEKLFFK